MVSKKMKGVALDPSAYGVREDAKTRFKHQTLMQDYQELVKEAEAVRNKLETSKQRKLTLLAEVRFLRRRYKYLLEFKSPKPPKGRELRKNTKKERINNRKEATLQKLAPTLDLNEKERTFSGKEAAFWNSTPILDLKQKERIYSGKEPYLQNPTPIFDLKQNDLNQKGQMYGGIVDVFPRPTLAFDLNQKERLYSGKGATLQNRAPVLDLNQKERTYSEKEAAVQSRAPIFDLNQISREEEEEEEFQDGCEPSRVEELKNCLIRSGSDEQQRNDLKLSVCRNVGNGSNRAGKRKISWQDQVALRV
ncbi:uncharacterized protein LOC132277890 [Cornus florida]|uniref:uncharacterized protein LOC132277890 n=1 Tax=Cornus florida TaxID=4283 RepID=UPI0028971413|nr:uncharacterized protein LOC132277890 [Cornus florida]